MSEYKMLAFFTSFITLYFIFMVPMGGANFFSEDFNYTEEDLTISPDIQQPQETVYDLQSDAIDSNNVEFYELSEVDGEVGGFDLSPYSDEIGTVVGATGNTTNSYIEYNVEGADRIELIVTGRSFDFTNIDLVFPQSGESTSALSSYESVTIPDGDSTARFEFGDSDSYLYYLESETGNQVEGVTGALNVFFAWAGSGLNWLFTLLSVAGSLPLYLNIPFVIYIGYLLVKAATLL